MKISTLGNVLECSSYISVSRISLDPTVLKNRLKSKTGFMLFLIIFVLSIFLPNSVIQAQNIRGLAPVATPKGGYAIDGNAYVNLPIAGDIPGGDLFFERLYPSPPASVSANPGGLFSPTFFQSPQLLGVGEYTFENRPDLFVYPNTFLYRDDITGNDPTIFTSSNKINDNPKTYTWGEGSSPNKNEIQNAIAHFTYGDPNLVPPGNEDHLWMIFAADRQVTNGSSYIDFEILQKSLLRTGTTSGTFTTEALDSQGGRTPGDILVTIEFTQGGGEATAVIRKWQAIQGGGYEYVIYNSFPSGSIFISNNTNATIVPYSVYNQDPLASGTFEGYYQYELNQWAEGAVDITALFGPGNPCFDISTLFIRTRTSGSSGQSELKDFPGRPIQLNLDLTPRIVIGKSDVKCFSSNDGVVNIISASGYDRLDLYKVGTPDVKLASNTDGSDFTGLSTGSYYVKAIKNSGNSECPANSEVVVITEPTIVVANDAHSDVSCNGGSDGSVTLTFSGGTPDYMIEFNGVGGFVTESSPKTYTGLAAGTYTWKVKDANGCEKSGSEIVGESSAVVATDAHSDVSCNGGNDGSVTLTFSGGTPDYMIEFNGVGGFVTESSPKTYTGLAAGTYTWKVKDANGCEKSGSEIVGESSAVVATDAHSDVSCNGGNDGSVTLTFSGGTPDYMVEFNGVGGFVTESSPKTYAGLAAGIYTWKVKDANGCEKSGSEIVGQPIEALSANAVPTAESCALNDGSIILTVSGGTAPYTYLWSNGATTKDLSGLVAGSYTVVITDKNSCSANSGAIVHAPANCIVDEGCTLGYWKNHTDRWCSQFTTCTLYISVFENSTLSPTLTLLQALNLKGNKAGENLGRQSVAALLNICSEGVGYSSEFASIGSLKDYVNAAFTSGAVNVAGSHLDMLNNAGCPLGGSRATTASNCPTVKITDNSSLGSSVINSFRAYPVPFREVLNIQYDFDYESAAVIQFFDLQGRLLRTYNESRAYKGQITQLNIDFRIRASQVYVVKITTSREVFTKTIVSDK